MRYAVFLAFLWLASLLTAQEYEVSVTTVTVWVKAVDSTGKSVTGLTDADFEIFEDDIRMQSSCFEEIRGGISLAPPESAQTTVTVDGALSQRKFVLFLDLFNMIPAEYGRIRPRLAEFLNQVNDAKQEVMIATLLKNGKLGIVTQFTSDIRRLERLLDQAGGKANAGRDQALANNRRQIDNILETARDDPRMFEAVVRSAYRQAQTFATGEKNSTMFSMSALESFSTHLAQRVGGDHVTLLYISGGFNVDPGRQYFDMVNRFVESRGDQDSTAVAMRFPSSVREFNFDVRDEIRKSVGRLNRQNITLYSINTRGTTSPGEDYSRFSADSGRDTIGILKDYQDSLWQIARETGGLAFENSNNFKFGLDRVMTDLEQQYVLCYSPPEHKKRGAYHRIRVVCKRPGVQLRHRLGYVD